MQRRVFSPVLFLIGLGVLVLCTGTLFFHLTPLDPWLTVGMAAFGLIICVASLAILMTGRKSRTAGHEGVVYGLALFVYGFANMILGIGAVFFGTPGAGAGLGVGAAVAGLAICVLSGMFAAAGS
jgi:hypothetical protein